MVKKMYRCGSSLPPLHWSQTFPVLLTRMGLHGLTVLDDETTEWLPATRSSVVKQSTITTRSNQKRNGIMVEWLLFHMTQPTRRSTTKSHCTKLTNHQEIADLCKQRGSLCHIGLVKDRGIHLVNQPCLSLFEKCWKTIVGDQTQSMVMKMYRWKLMPMYTDEWIKSQ